MKRRKIKLTRAMDDFYRVRVVAALKKDFFLEEDGHTIFNAAYYIGRGFPQRFVHKYCRTFESDLGGHPKNNIFDDKMHIIPAVRGVYNLEMLWGVAKLVDADTKIAMEVTGRGFMARALCHSIKLAIGVEAITY